MHIVYHRNILHPDIVILTTSGKIHWSQFQYQYDSFWHRVAALFTLDPHNQKHTGADLFFSQRTSFLNLMMQNLA